MALTRLGRLIVVGTILAILVGLMTYSVEPMTQYSIDEVMDSVDQPNPSLHQLNIGSLVQRNMSSDQQGLQESYRRL